MKFKDMQQGKEYTMVNKDDVVLSGRYLVKDNLLYSIDLKKFSYYTAEEVSTLKFTEVPKINKTTQLFLQLFNNKYNWIAKDDDGDINFFEKLPVKDFGDDYWDDSFGSAYEFNHLDYFNEDINFDFIQPNFAYKIQELIIMA